MYNLLSFVRFIVYIVKTGLHLCCLNEVLDLYAFSQVLQGRTMPSKWWTSMWSLMVVRAPSFPHSLHFFALSFLSSLIIFGLSSIIDFTWASSSCKSVETLSANFFSGLLPSFKSGSFLQTTLKLVGTLCFWICLRALLVLCFKSKLALDPWYFFSMASLSSINPLSWRSAARAKKELRLSWKTSTSPKYGKSMIALKSSNLNPYI